MVACREQAQDDRADVAFLLCCTALEYLLGSEEPISRTLSNRLGAVVALGTNVPYEQAVENVKRLYRARSKFVHEAKVIRQDDLQEFEGYGSCCISLRIERAPTWDREETEADPALAG